MIKINSHILKAVIVTIGILIFSLCIFVLPPLASQTARTYPEVAYLQYPVLLGLYSTAIPFFIALFQSLKIIYYADRGHVFTNATVKALTIIKSCAQLIIVLYLAGLIILVLANALHPGVLLLGIVILIMTIMVVTGSSLMQQLLQQTIVMKQDNLAYEKRAFH